MKNFLFCLVLFSLSLNACKNNSKKKCDLLLRKANDNLYQFYSSNDTLLLLSAKEYLDSIDCNSFKYKIFNIKTTLFILLKEYSEGIEYIKTLSSADFNRAYQKNMYLKSFEAMQCEAKGDTVSSIKLYAEVAREIQDYLDKNPKQEVLIDLYIVKSKIEKRDAIIRELELLETTGKYNNDFLETLIIMMTTENGVEGVAGRIDE